MQRIGPLVSSRVLLPNHRALQCRVFWHWRNRRDCDRDVLGCLRVQCRQLLSTWELSVCREFMCDGRLLHRRQLGADTLRGRGFMVPYRILQRERSAVCCGHLRHGAGRRKLHK